MDKKIGRFDRAYNALIDSYFNGTLAKGTCVACAVGNIVADAMGAEIVKNSNSLGGYDCTEKNYFWSNLFKTCDKVQEIKIREYPESATRLKELTGYTAEELARIEYAFETNTTLDTVRETYKENNEQEILEDQFNGLKAVVEVMLEMEEMADTGQIAKFREHPKLQMV